MNDGASSDGAIVIAKPVVDPTREVPFLTTLRYAIPDFIIAIWIGALLGSVLVTAIRYSMQ